MVEKKKLVHLALQGGGAHGAFTWGILDKILEDGRLDIDGICATSAGSMNAVVCAYGLMQGGRDRAREALYDFWHDISNINVVSGMFMPYSYGMLWNELNYNIFDIVSHIMSPYQFNPFNINLLRDILERSVDFDQLKACKTKLFLTATNVRTGRVRIFDNNDLSLDVVMASACLPYLFQAVRVGEEYYWDGGYMGNPAIFPLFYHSNTRDVIVIHINPIIRSKLPTNAHEIMNRINEISFNSSLENEFRAISFVKKLLEKNWIKEKYRKHLHNILLHSIRADTALHDFDISSKFNTDWNFLVTLRDLGRIEAENWLSNNYKMIGKKSTVDINKEFLGINGSNIT